MQCVACHKYAPPGATGSSVASIDVDAGHLYVMARSNDISGYRWNWIGVYDR